MSSYLEIARQAAKREERHKMDEDYAHMVDHLSPLARREQSLDYESRETYKEQLDTLTLECEKATEATKASQEGWRPGTKK